MCKRQKNTGRRRKVKRTQQRDKDQKKISGNKSVENKKNNTRNEENR